MNMKEQKDITIFYDYWAKSKHFSHICVSPILLEKQSSAAVGIIHSTTCAAKTFSFVE